MQDLGNYPDAGPYIVVINHLHWLDLPQVFTTFRHVVAGLMNRKWERHPIAGPITRHIGHAIPIDPTGADPRGIAKARRWLEAGGCLLIAPEGTRSKSGALREGLRGAAFLSNRTGAPLVPVAMWGQEKVGRAWRRLGRPTVTTAVGTPIRWEWSSPRAGTAELDACTSHVMLALARMLPPEYRGAYADSAPGQAPLVQEGR